MPSPDFKRSDRISDLIKVEISNILSFDVKDPRVRGITVLRVELSSDMKSSFIFFSSENSFNDLDSEQILVGLEKAKGFIRKKLSSNLNLRRTPEIFFKEESNL
jgi:ribosome-binding factor A